MAKQIESPITNRPLNNINQGKETRLGRGERGGRGMYIYMGRLSIDMEKYFCVTHTHTACC